MQFLLSSFTASDCPEGTTAGYVVWPHSTMVHHGFRSKEVKHAGGQNIDYTKQHHTPHCWLPTMVMHPVISTNRFSWLTHSTSIFRGTFIYIYSIVLGKALGFIVDATTGQNKRMCSISIEELHIKCFSLSSVLCSCYVTEPVNVEDILRFIKCLYGIEIYRYFCTIFILCLLIFCKLGLETVIICGFI